MSDRTWVPFTDAKQAEPGRRMRVRFYGHPHWAVPGQLYTIVRREVQNRRWKIVFENNQTIVVTIAKKFGGWMIEQ